MLSIFAMSSTAGGLLIVAVGVILIAILLVYSEAAMRRDRDHNERMRDLYRNA